jgi:hypothetical protein
VPFVSPVTVADVAVEATVAVRLPGDEVTIYPVIAFAAAFGDGAKFTNAIVSPAVALTVVGIEGGAMNGNVTVLLGAEGPLFPAPLLAVTRKAYVPFATPGMTRKFGVKPPAGAVTV